MRLLLKKAIASLMTAALSLSVVSLAFPAMDLQAEENENVVTQFMDCIEPMPIVESLSSDVWGAPEVGARDQGNGLEDRTMAQYSYWDGGILKDDETGKYFMFASRWNQAGGHWGENGIDGWRGSQAIYAVSDNLYGPYEDKGPIWPDWCEGAGHNVFPFKLSESDPLYGDGYRYAISISDTGKHGDIANGTIHIAKSVDGPWSLMDNGNNGKLNARGGNGFSLSNVSIMVRPDGKYAATNRNGDIAIADSLSGVWDVKENGIWWKVSGMSSENIEDPVIWYSDGLYHIVANKWDARMAYYLTSEDGITNWRRHPGTAYTPDVEFLRYTDGTVNNWTKIERPNIYVEDGKIKAMIFAVIDVQKEDDHANDRHGSKVIVVPFSQEKLTAFATQPDPLANRGGIVPIADTNSQSWGNEISKNYGAEQYIQIQKDPNFQNLGKGYMGEGQRPNDSYDNKIGYLNFDISDYDLSDVDEIEDVYLSLVYLSRHSGRATKQRIQATLSDTNWIEGTGRESQNNNYAEAGSLIWENQPALLYDNNNIENTSAISEEFSLSITEKEVRIDVTKLLKQFVKEYPEETVIGFAINEAETGNRLRLGSKEAGNSYAPKLIFKSDDPDDPNGPDDPVDSKEELNQTIKAYDNLKAVNYTSDSWKVFSEALRVAKIVAGDKEATSQQIENAVKSLKDAYEKLKPATVEVNKTELNKLISAEKGFVEKEYKGKYSSKSWKDFEKALSNALTVSGNPKATQVQVTAAQNMLKAAKKGLLKLAGKTFTYKKAKYKITKITPKSKTVAFVNPGSKKLTKFSIPKSVGYDGQKFKVTQIAAKAFKNNKNLKSVTIGENVKSVGKFAFKGISKSATIRLSKKLGKKAKNELKKAVIKAGTKNLKFK